MRDLSGLEGRGFDLVSQPPFLSHVPSSREVYGEVDRVLRLGGIYRLEVTNLAAQFVDETWRDGGHRITKPFSERVKNRETGEIDDRHCLRDFFNGLLEIGYRIEHVKEAPMHLTGAEPGSWSRMLVYIARTLVGSRPS